MITTEPPTIASPAPRRTDATGVARRGYFPATPLSPEHLRSLQQLSTWATAGALTIDWVLIAVATAVSWLGFDAYGLTVFTVLVYLLALVVIGSRQKGLENLTHEGMHYHLSPSRATNEWIGKWLCGIWIAPGFDPSGQRVSHVGDHHGHFAEPGRDIEFHAYENLGLGDLPLTSVGASLRTLLIAFLRKTWWRLHGDYLSNPRRLLVIIVGAAVLWLVGIVHLVVLYWVVPYVLVYLPLRYMAEVSEHMGVGFSTEFATTRNKLGWFQERVMHPHGDGYHLVHHLYPGIPHQNLRRAHTMLMQDEVYRTKGHHTHAFLLSFRGRATTLGELLAHGTPSRSRQAHCA
jgi:fatty acid desaturase